MKVTDLRLLRDWAECTVNFYESREKGGSCLIALMKEDYEMSKLVLALLAEIEGAV